MKTPRSCALLLVALTAAGCAHTKEAIDERARGMSAAARFEARQVSRVDPNAPRLDDFGAPADVSASMMLHGECYRVRDLADRYVCVTGDALDFSDQGGNGHWGGFDVTPREGILVGDSTKLVLYTAKSDQNTRRGGVDYETWTLDDPAFEPSSRRPDVFTQDEGEGVPPWFTNMEAPALLRERVAGTSRSAEVRCGDSPFTLETLSEEERQALLGRAELSLPPPGVSVSVYESDDGAVASIIRVREHLGLVYTIVDIDGVPHQATTRIDPLTGYTQHDFSGGSRVISNGRDAHLVYAAGGSTVSLERRAPDAKHVDALRQSVLSKYPTHDGLREGPCTALLVAPPESRLPAP